MKHCYVEEQAHGYAEGARLSQGNAAYCSVKHALLSSFRRDAVWENAGLARLLGGLGRASAPTSVSPAPHFISSTQGQHLTPVRSAVLRLPIAVAWFVLALLFALLTYAQGNDLASIPAGTFEMGDHHGFVDPKHGGDETPLHTVRLDAFQIGLYDVTTAQYAAFLNNALTQGRVEVREGGVYFKGGSDLLFETRSLSPYSRIGYDGSQFSVLDRKELHPVVCVRWEGAAAYCNARSAQEKLAPCYNETTWQCDFTKPGYRLPTEAEWEYAARGGLQNPYRNFPWGDEPDPAKANWPESDNPFRAGPEPWTTPVGFFDGKLQRKSELQWPGSKETYQSANGANGYGLYDMAGNVWQFVNDWYDRDYYGKGPADNPTGPERGSRMPDGKPYRGMRGGNWYNGEHGHSRVSNRDPSYFRGPLDPNHPYYHIGFRVAKSAGLARSESPKPAAPPAPAAAGFVLRSPAVSDGGNLPVAYTGDGDGATLPLEWSGAPEGTKSFAVILHHIAPDMTKWYWILYDIPANVQSLPRNVTGVGVLGNNSVNERAGYAPPHSKGPGPKKYIYTVYALSAPPAITVAPDRVSRDVLLEAMKGRILAQAELNVVYSRQGEGPAPEPRGERPTEPRGERPPARGSWWNPWSWGSHEPPPPPPPPGDRNGRPRPPRAQEERPAPPPAPTGRQAAPREEATGQTIGLFLKTPKAFDGYTLFAPKHNTMTYLLNNDGQPVHAWTRSEFEPGQTVYLLENGHLLRCCFTHTRGFTSGGEGGRIEEYDWDDNLVWEFDYANDAHMLHHDIRVLPNGNILALAVEKKGYNECLAAGFDPRMLRDGELYPDYVIEIEPTRPKGGRIVWEWHGWDHLVQDNDAQLPNYAPPRAHPGRIDVDCNGRPAPAFWNHMNAIDYSPALDQIMLSVRGCNEIWILDHSTTTEEARGETGGRSGKGGGLLYRWGNPAAYGAGTENDRQLFDQHDAQWIPAGSPGAGHILLFNNGLDRGYSSIEEIAPEMDAAGNYALNKNLRPVWHYEAKEASSFFSGEISGAQRLPNGNTLICEGVHGTFFEVTPAGEAVWRYVNPVIGLGPLAQGEQAPRDHRGHDMNAVFKVRRYAPDYAAFAGKALTGSGVIERPASERRSQAELEALPGATGPAGPERRQGGKNDAPGSRRNSGDKDAGNSKIPADVIRSLGYF